MITLPFSLSCVPQVKRRVRTARRKLKRESKVQLSDEIIFFDDVAGNPQAKVGGDGVEWGGAGVGGQGGEGDSLGGGHGHGMAKGRLLPLPPQAL